MIISLFINLKITLNTYTELEINNAITFATENKIIFISSFHFLNALFSRYLGVSN